MKKKVLKALVLLLLGTQTSQAQIEGYRYRRPLGTVTAGWHQLFLPNSLLNKSASQLEDVRILGLAATGDTLEVPYVIRSSAAIATRREVAFKTLNESHNAQGYFYTFEIPKGQTVNELTLSVANQNFDWRVQLEGSQDQSEWFQLLDDYRILDIQNSETAFRFTTLRFPDARFRYLRLGIKSPDAPRNLSAVITQIDTAAGSAVEYLPVGQHRSEAKNPKQSFLEWTLPEAAPVNRVVIPVLDSLDYYRPITLEVLTDSFQTGAGWRYNWLPVTSGTLHVLAPGDFLFDEVLAQRLRLVVENGDNQPLQLGSPKTYGPRYHLLARFREKSDYFLYYGRPGARPPDYDLTRFPERLPATAPEIPLGENEAITATTPLTRGPLFQNKVWLWLIIGVVAGLLSWATLRMLRKDGTEAN